MPIGPAILAFLLASMVTWLELITSYYPRTAFLLIKNSWALWIYPTIYGLLAAGASLTGVLSVQGVGLANPWIEALAIGLSTKALLHIRLFTVGAGSKSFPVGTETLVQLFEPWLLRTIEIDEFNAVRDFIEPRAKKHSTLSTVQSTIKTNIPSSLPSQEREAFILDINKATDVTELMEIYLRQFGRKTFDRVFPA